MKVHPAAVLLLLVLGAHVAGLWGIILSVPVAATAMRIIQYFRGLKARNDIACQPAEATESLSQEQGAA
jgi:predicted PurR-regulated permease PerM